MAEPREDISTRLVAQVRDVGSRIGREKRLQTCLLRYMLNLCEAPLRWVIFVREP